MAAPDPEMAALLASLQEQAPGLDMATLLAMLQGQQGHNPSQQAFQQATREASRAEIFRILNARFTATRACFGNRHTARHAVDALTDSDEPLPLPPADLTNIGWVLMDHPFAPCTTGLDDLLPVALKDLVMGRHHRGKFLLVALVKVIKIGDLETILGIKDAAGDAERLKINTVCTMLHKGHQWPQSGHWFVIKEPFLTLDEKKDTNSPCIRIDHPSDLLDAHSLSDSLLERKSLDRVLTAVGKRTAQLCKESGNFSFVQGNLVASHDSYTEGLQIITNDTEQHDDTIKQDLHRKRAHVRLKMGRYEGAIADTLASLSDDPDTMSDRLNAQAYFVAASAHYNLKHFDRAHKFLQKQLKLTPEAKSGQELLKKTNKRLGEQRDGIYDVDAIKSAFGTQPRIDAADYCASTVIKASGPGRGRGLFAARDLAPGDLILAETAFACVWAGEEACIVTNKWSVRYPDELPSLLAGLWTSLVQKIGNNPVDGQRFLDLHGAYNSADSVSKIVHETDDTSAVDTYQVHDIMIRNVFALVPAGPPDPSKRGSSGVFVRSSYINHACLPNSDRMVVGDFTMVHATKPIAKGEEITVCYDGPKLLQEPFEKRMRDMQMDWQFQCSCRLCLAQARCSPAEHSKRDELAKVAKEIMHAPWSVPNSYQRMEQLAREIAATYDADLYSGLPLMATIPAHVFFFVHTRAANDSFKTMRSAIGLLRACGYQVDLQNNEICHVAPTANSFIWNEPDVVRKPLIDQALKAHIAGNTKTAKHLLDFASTLERICSGGDVETSKTRNEYSV